MSQEPFSSRLGNISHYLERIFLASSLYQTIILLVVAFTAVFSIAEIAARESVLSMLSGQISALKAEFVDQNRNAIPDTAIAAQSASSDSNKSPNISIATEERMILLKEIRSAELLKRSLQTLIVLGSDTPTFSLRSIQKNFNQFFAESKSATAQANTLSTFMLESSAALLLLSSDQLLAIAIMACGAIGAMITTLRGDGGMTLRALSLGVASGFVVYLAIKGGKHVFLLQAQGEIVAFNPYGGAFAGLLGGLFTERAHQVLSTIVDDFVERLRAASGGKKE